MKFLRFTETGSGTSIAINMATVREIRPFRKDGEVAGAVLIFSDESCTTVTETVDEIGLRPEW